MALTIRENSPVKFITGNYIGFDDLTLDCNCRPRDFSQLVERADTTSFQVGLRVVGAEAVQNGDFAAPTGWDFAAGNWTFDAGNFEADSDASIDGDLLQPFILGIGNYYKLTYTIKNYVSGSLIPKLGTTSLTSRSANGTFTDYGFQVGNRNLVFSSTAFIASIDDVTVKEMTTLGFRIIDCADAFAKPLYEDFSNIDVTYFEDIAQVDFPWNKVELTFDGCYQFCLFEILEDLIVNGGFRTPASWVFNGLWVHDIGNGEADIPIPGPPSAGDNLEQLAIMNVGDRYKIRLEQLNVVPGIPLNTIVSNNPDINPPMNFLDNGTHIGVGVNDIASGGALQIQTGPFQGSVDNVSVHQVIADACSECFKLATTHTCTFGVTWTNDENAFTFEYAGLSFTHFVRLEGKLWKPRYEKGEKDVFADSVGNRKILYSRTTKVRRFTLFEIPEYLHDAIGIGLEHDTLRIDGVEYVNEEDDYEPLWRKSSLLAPAEVEVILDPQCLVNANC